MNFLLFIFMLIIVILVYRSFRATDQALGLRPKKKASQRDDQGGPMR